MKEFAYFTLSVCFHIFLITLALYQSEPHSPENETPFQVDLIEPAQKKPPAQIVTGDLVDKLENLEKKARALSDKKRRVELESRKRNQNRGLRAPIKKQRIAKKGRAGQQKRKTEKGEIKKDLLTDDRGFVQKLGREPLNLPYSPTSGIPAPKVPQNVLNSLPPGIELGNVSALNTDQHLFFNFHSRLIGGFAPLWGSLVSRQVYRWMENNSFPKVSKTWVTNVEVILSDQGEVLDVQHYRLSGLWPFDEAPVKAFKQLKLIPNPPKEMIGDDGYIRLKFQTEVHWRPRPLGGIGISSDRNRTFR